jgi:biotin operon repressor/predicted nucleotidyltransferase
MPIFRTETQAQVLACLYLRQQETWTSASLARELGVSASTMHAEIQRLEEVGLITASQVGRARVLHANLAHPLAGPLAQIVEYVYGPRAVVAEEFGQIPGISRLLIFGSWAARHLGSTGPVPHDVDVLVVGSAERGAVYAAADRAQDRIGMPVNPVLSSRRRWDADADALILQIKSGPVIDLTEEARQSQPGKATA